MPGLPGFFYTVLKKDLGSSAVKIFQIDYFVGFPLGFLTYIALSYMFPPAGLGERRLIAETGEEGEAGVIEGEGIEISGKDVAVIEKRKQDGGDF